VRSPATPDNSEAVEESLAPQDWEELRSIGQQVGEWVRHVDDKRCFGAAADVDWLRVVLDGQGFRRRMRV
jgi:predicted transglutaminase-like cysteine proteinase